MVTISQTPAALALTGVGGNPFSIAINFVAITTTTGASVGWDSVSNPTVIVTDQYGNSVPGGSPSVTSPADSELLLSWTAAQTLAISNSQGTRWSLEVTITGVGPFALVAGALTFPPPTYGSNSVATTYAALGTNMVDLTVQLGGATGVTNLASPDGSIVISDEAGPIVELSALAVAQAASVNAVSVSETYAVATAQAASVSAVEASEEFAVGVADAAQTNAESYAFTTTQAASVVTLAAAESYANAASVNAALVSDPRGYAATASVGAETYAFGITQSASVLAISSAETYAFGLTSAASTAAIATSEAYALAQAQAASVNAAGLSVPLAGVTPMTGPLILSGPPTTGLQAATKTYVDSSITGLAIKNPVNFATAASLPSNAYNNGTAGVGATLTAIANGALVVDSDAVALNNRILVQNETNAANNGIYSVTAIGGSGAEYVLTRTTDMNTGGASPNEFTQAYAFVLAGSVNAGAGFVCSTAGSVNVGTTPITFTQFESGSNYTAGQGLQLVGSQFSMPNVGTPGTYGSATSIPQITTDAEGRVSSASVISVAFDPLGAAAAASVGAVSYAFGITQAASVNTESYALTQARAASVTAAAVSDPLGAGAAASVGAIAAAEAYAYGITQAASVSAETYAFGLTQTASVASETYAYGLTSAASTAAIATSESYALTTAQSASVNALSISEAFTLSTAVNVVQETEAYALAAAQTASVNAAAVSDPRGYAAAASVAAINVSEVYTNLEVAAAEQYGFGLTQAASVATEAYAYGLTQASSVGSNAYALSVAQSASVNAAALSDPRGYASAASTAAITSSFLTTQSASTAAVAVSEAYALTQAQSASINAVNVSGSYAFGITQSASVATESYAFTTAQSASINAVASVNASNLVGLANPGTSRSNLHVGILGSCQTVATASVSTTAPGNGPWSGASVTIGGGILLTAQTTGSQNGPWIFNGPSSSLTRPTDYATGASVGSRTIQISAGTYANTEWMTSNTSTIVVDTAATTWTLAYTDTFVPTGTGGTGLVLEALLTGLATDPQWAGGADNTGVNLCDSALAAVVAGSRSVFVPRGVYKISQKWLWNWWTNVFGQTGQALSLYVSNISGTIGTNTLTTTGNFLTSGVFVGMTVSSSGALPVYTTVISIAANGLSLTVANDLVSTVTNTTFSFNDSGTLFIWEGASGAQAMGTPTLASVSNPNLVRFVGRVQDFTIVYPSASMANGSTGVYVALPANEINNVYVNNDVIAEVSVASCTTSGSSTTLSSTNNFATAGVTVGLQLCESAIPQFVCVSSCTTSGSSTTVSSTNNFATSGVVAGAEVFGSLIPHGTTVISVSGTSVVLSNAVDIASTENLLFGVTVKVTAVSGTSVTLSAPINIAAAATVWFVTPYVPGTQAIWLDGAQTSAPNSVVRSGGVGQWEDGIRIATDLCTLIGGQTGYGAFCWTLANDSINSTSGPPYFITVTNPHGYHHTKAWAHFQALTSATVVGGGNENAYGPQVSNYLYDPGCAGNVAANGPGYISGGYWFVGYPPPIVCYGFGGHITYADVQQQQTTSWVGVGSTTGAIARYDNLPTRNDSNTGTYTLTATSNTVVLPNANAISQGPSNGFVVTVTFIATSTSAASLTVSLGQQATTQPTQGSAWIGSVAAQQTYALQANEPLPLTVVAGFGSQNVNGFFALVGELAAAGSVALSNIRIQVSAI